MEFLHVFYWATDILFTWFCRSPVLLLIIVIGTIPPVNETCIFERAGRLAIFSPVAGRFWILRLGGKLAKLVMLMPDVKPAAWLRAAEVATLSLPEENSKKRMIILGALISRLESLSYFVSRKYADGSRYREWNTFKVLMPIYRLNFY